MEHIIWPRMAFICTWYAIIPFARRKQLYSKHLFQVCVPACAPSACLWYYIADVAALLFWRTELLGRWRYTEKALIHGCSSSTRLVPFVPLISPSNSNMLFLLTKLEKLLILLHDIYLHHSKKKLCGFFHGRKLESNTNQHWRPSAYDISRTLLPIYIWPSLCQGQSISFRPF